MLNKLRIALVGCGPISERHLLSWKNTPEAEVVALCDRHEENLEQRSSEFGIKRTFKDFKKLLEEVDCDIIDIATRPYSHKELVFEAAQAGKHILCQKPFAPTLREAQAMIGVCQDKGVRFMICENWRWFIWFRTIRDILNSGEIGEVKYARITSHTLLVSAPSYFKDMERLIIYEMGVHYADVFRFLFGDANSVYARTGKMSFQIAGEDLALIILDFGKMYGIIDISWCSRDSKNKQKSEEMLIEGSKGSIILDEQGRIKIIREDGKINLPEYDWKEETKLQTHFRLHKHFVEGILE
jgi:predicted dehydrogenase